MTAAVDLAHGGRWTSLWHGGREWLWQRPDPARFAVRPGDAFVDAGGLEECIPTVRGTPDHGSAWSRPWLAVDDETAIVQADDFTLTRTIGAHGDAVVAGYRLSAAPGWSFVWAAHALLDLSGAARLRAPAGTVTHLDGGGVVPWPSGLDRLGPDDGSAIGAILTDCPRVDVADGDAEVSFILAADGQPVSVALWRNLRGWPAAGPYRSIGVEPMLGRVFDRDTAGPGDLAVVPASGVCTWSLTIAPST